MLNTNLTASNLRPELIARIKRENPSVDLNGPVIETDKYVPSWGMREVSTAGKFFAIAPDALEKAEAKFPAVANLVRSAEKAVFSTLPLHGAVIGLVLGEADAYDDDQGISSARLHALSLQEPYVSSEALGTLYVDTHDNKAYIHLTQDKVAVEEVAPAGEGYTAELDKDVLQTLRDLFEEAGGRMSSAPTEPHRRGLASQNGKLLLDFDYGTPQTLATPSGNFDFASGSTSGSGDYQKKFMSRLAEVFDIKEVAPQRDDSRLSISSHAFQHEYSGPVLELSPKKGVKLSPFRNVPESMKKPEGFDQKAVERLLESFLNAPQDTDQTLTAEQATSVLTASKERREKLESLDNGAEVDRTRDTDTRPGFVEVDHWGDRLQTELQEKGLVQLETSKYIGQTYRIERMTENGLVGIELEGSSRYAEGVVYQVTPQGGRSRDLFFKETLEGKI
jgi:hypothetical protein